MPLTTTDSLNGRKPKAQRCGKCRERSQMLVIGPMNEKLCHKCAPDKIRIGYPVEE